MVKQSSDDEHEENSADDEYPLTEGDSLVCSSCGKQVAVIYRPQSKYPMRSSGFWLECECAMGPQIGHDTVEELHPPWYVNKVQETEENPEEWVRYYMDDRRDASDWLEGDGNE